jgi:hypothetical protein
MNHSVVISELGARLGMQGLSLDTTGTCQLVFDQLWLVTISYNPSAQSLCLRCPVNVHCIPEHLGVDVLVFILQGNFSGAAANGITLAIGPDKRLYLQSLVLELQSDGQVLQNSLEELLNHAEIWSERLERETAVGDGKAAQAALQQFSNVRESDSPKQRWKIQKV